MQSILVNSKITKKKIISRKDFKTLTISRNYLLFSDNILEGITLLNDLTQDDKYLFFYGVVYEPMDQPIYVFQDIEERKYAIKICGAYDKWELPEDVSRIINYIDLPDYIFYSLESKKAILAGENTETASVGNSQWQREGRKLGAAKEGVPFIYQTFYSGKDESQSTIREPSSLQVYNHLVYSVRYKVPSFVAYFDNNFKDSNPRKRKPADSKLLFNHYIKSVLLSNCDVNYLELTKQLENDFFRHMINYIKEPKLTDFNKGSKKPRLDSDLPCLKKDVRNQLIKNTDRYVCELVDYLHETDVSAANIYRENCDLLNFDESKFEKWTSYNSKPAISEVISHLLKNGNNPESYVKGSSKVGFVDSNLCQLFLDNKFAGNSAEINATFERFNSESCILMPLRIHKNSNNKLTFSPDPESGEIVAFTELFSKDICGNKIKPIVGYCIVEPPLGFNIRDKEGTKMYKALAECVDVLVINNNVYTSLENDFAPDNYSVPLSLCDANPTGLTEEKAVVSAYLNQTTINSDWKLCFIHTHHSSWQQLVIYNKDNNKQVKIDRKSTKVDLIMQDDNKFMICEGKNDFMEFISDKKIKKAMFLAGEKIDKLFVGRAKKMDAFIYNMHTNPRKNPEFYIEREAQTLQLGIHMGHMEDIAHHKNYLVIIVYTDSNYKTRFKLVYSENFDSTFKSQLDKEFNQ